MVTMLVWACLLSGCSGHPHHRACREDRQGRPCRAATVVVADRPRVSPGLIFDRRPGLYSASDFNWRSDWPSTDSYYRGPEVVMFREYFHDTQGLGWNNFDSSYRHFDSYRVGTATR
jgi:hypothetical protein